MGQTRGPNRPTPDGAISAVPLAVTDLHVRYGDGTEAVRGIDLTVHDGERFAIVGESGCGKTSLLRACLGLLPAGAQATGSVVVAGTEVIGGGAGVLQALRGRIVGYVPQDPLRACDPLRRVVHHVEESWKAHGMRPGRATASGLLTQLGIRKAALAGYPHQWSGGMLQRATIAAATAHCPPLTLADEPTSALDADLADDVLHALSTNSRALLLVTHDLGLLRRHVDTIAICYAGRVVETGDAEEVLGSPRHPYTRALLAASPRQGGGLPVPLGGAPPGPSHPDAGCAFAPRCQEVIPLCWKGIPPLTRGVACVRR
jgi:oligopeptide/dipeptide ABC transporter ATP-binding protein